MPEIKTDMVFAGRYVVLEELDSSGGQVFAHGDVDASATQLGYSVAGLDDRRMPFT